MPVDGRTVVFMLIVVLTLFRLSKDFPRSDLASCKKELPCFLACPVREGMRERMLRPV